MLDKLYIACIKKHLGFVCALFVFIMCLDDAYSQVFNGTTGAIADAATTDFTVTVQNLPVSTLTTTYGVVAVTLNITHTWDSDLDVYLLSPDATQHELFTDVGGIGNNFAITTITMICPYTFSANVPPYNHPVLPETGNLLTTFNGKAGNGTWTLRVTDDTGGDVGTVISWSLTFGFVNNSSLAIPDNNLTFSTRTISVSGLGSSTINASWGLEKFIVDISHTWDADLDFQLKAPDNTTLNISSNNGGSSDNFWFTRFEDAAGTNVTAGSAPFYGSYKPEGAGTITPTINNGQDPNGTWTLEIRDDASGYVGTLYGWALVFPEITCFSPSTVTATTNTPTICSGSTGNFQYSSHTGGNLNGGSWEYQWETTSTYGGGSVVRAWNTTAIYSPTLTSTKTYYLYMRSTACNTDISPASNGVTVTVNSNPSSVEATADGSTSKTICNGSSVALSGSKTGGSCGGSGSWEYKWYDVTNTTTIDDWDSNINCDPDPSPSSTTTYRLYVRCSTCSSGSTVDDVVVTVNKPPTSVTANADGSASLTICGSNSVNLTKASDAGNGNCSGGNWEYAWYDGSNYWNGTVFSSGSPVYNTFYNSINYTVSSTTNFTLYMRCSSCATSITDGLAVTVDTPPATPDAGEDQYICGATTTMDAEAGAGTWTLLNGIATITTSGSNTSGITGLVAGSEATLRWTVGGACTSYDDVVITTQP